MNKKHSHKRRAVLLVGLLLLLLSVGVALAAGNIDGTHKWAWGTNVGWLNFNPDNGGVTVYSDHLEGYAWGENVGWVRLGTCTGGSPCTYTNDAAGAYGVNNDGVGNLSGYAWGTNIGWLNFAPGKGGVWVDPVTGEFEGDAWGENVGWLRLKGTAQNSDGYKVATAWHGDLLAAYQNDIAAIITTHRPGKASSGGLMVADGDFLTDSGDGIIFGHDAAAFADDVTDNLPADVDKRWARIWQLDVNDGAGTSGGAVTLTFDISDAGGTGEFSKEDTYYLLKRAAGSSDPFTIVTVTKTTVDGDQLGFEVSVSELGSEFTVGAAVAPTAVTLRAFRAAPRFDPAAWVAELLRDWGR